jgi:hypothetical protein
MGGHADAAELCREEAVMKVENLVLTVSATLMLAVGLSIERGRSLDAQLYRECLATQERIAKADAAVSGRLLSSHAQICYRR